MLTSVPAEPNYSVEETVDLLPDDLFGMLDPEDEAEAEPEVVAQVDEDEDEVDEDEGSEDTQETESEEADEAEADVEVEEKSEAKEPEDKDQLFDIEIDNEVYEVNLEELKFGYLRGEDYLKKVNQLDQAKQEWEREASQERAAALSEIEDFRREFSIKGADFENVDWGRLKAENPQEYVIKRAQYAELIEQRGKLEQQRVALGKLEQKHRELEIQQYMAKQQDLVRKLIPEWNDDEKRSELQKSLAAYGIQQGLSEEEIGSLSDARLLALLNKARLYDESQRKRKEVAEKRVPKEVQTAIKPGVSQGQSAPSGKRVKAAAARFKENGSLTNAADYLDAIGFELPTTR